MVEESTKLFYNVQYVFLDSGLLINVKGATCPCYLLQSDLDRQPQVVFVLGGGVMANWGVVMCSNRGTHGN